MAVTVATILRLGLVRAPEIPTHRTPVEVASCGHLISLPWSEGRMPGGHGRRCRRRCGRGLARTLGYTLDPLGGSGGEVLLHGGALKTQHGFQGIPRLGRQLDMDDHDAL